MQYSKKLFSLFLALILVLGSVSSVFADDVKQINSIGDLLGMKNDPDGSYILMRDFNMSDYFDENEANWEAFEFRGKLDGNGHSITGLRINASSGRHLVYDANMKEYDAVCGGMFSTLLNAEIVDLKLFNAEVNIGDDIYSETAEFDESAFAGVLAGYSYNSRIAGCEFTGTVAVSTSGHCFGTGGIVGFGGHNSFEGCTTDTTLVCVDTDKSFRDEQFMGGVFAMGYGNIQSCNIHIDGYDSDHGYVHNGGMVGCFMYYDKVDVGQAQLLNNRVSGRITFFEDNRDRRAYCEAYIGEHMSWAYGWSGNSSNFLRNEVYDYSRNLLPEYDWSTDSVGKTDLLLISSHADDEQLFFAGILPYYTQVADLNVQVLYVTDNSESSGRQQEREKGLYQVGVRTRPDSIRIYDDAAILNLTDPQEGIKVAAKYGFTEEVFIEALHEKIMKYKPQVIVTHDINGEYHHGMHILVNAMVRKCLERHSGEYDFLKKVYFHLYDENPIVLSVIDEPSEKLGGKTAFQITQENGFSAHKSQHWTWFYDWIYGKAASPITQATQIKTYSPLKYGLYYGDASSDKNADDFFEGLISWDEQKRIQRREAVETALEAAKDKEIERLREFGEAEKLAKRKRFVVLLGVGISVIIIAASAAVSIKRRRKKND